ncbi:MAG: hypothetical protein ABEK59_01445 [Halobacteria archaeon]
MSSIDKHAMPGSIDKHRRNINLEDLDLSGEVVSALKVKGT